MRGEKTSFDNRKLKTLSVALFVLLVVWMDVPLHSFLNRDMNKAAQDYDIAVSAISLAVTVTNRSGKHINDLTAEDFGIYENEVKKEITYFSHDYNAPLSLTILLDVSGSMALQDKLSESKEALHNFVSSFLNERNELSLLIFADGAVEVAVGFSHDKNDFLEVLENTEAYGQTALHDAVAVAPDYSNRGSSEKRALLLITDGIENDSQFSLDQALEIARRVDIPIFTIGYKIPLSEQFLEKYKRSPSLTALGILDTLNKLSSATGGEAFFINQADDLTAAFEAIQKDLSHQYIIGYTSYMDLKNEYRKIKVVTTKKKYTVRTREGYFSGEKKNLRF